MRSEGPLDAERAADIGAEIAAALSFAHRNGVVHRDIKPGNVLIAPSGGVKVTDFGIARAGTSENLTQTGSVMGTATYFSPEQAQGLAVDGRSDVYSLGVVLYEMVTGLRRSAATRPSRSRSSTCARSRSRRACAITRSPRRLRADRARRVGEGSRSALPVGRRPARRPPALPSRSPAGEHARHRDDRDDGRDRVHSGSRHQPRGADPTVASPRVEAGAPRRPAGPPPRGGRSGLFSTIIVFLLLALVVGGIFALAQANSKNQGTKVVPDVTGIDLDQARQTLADDGFGVKTESVPNATVPVNQVISQSPDGNSRAKKGSTVTLKVSQGSGQITIQDVAGTTVADATRILKDQGLKVGSVKRARSDTVPVDTVIRTDPPAGESVGKNFAVVLIVSAGPKPVTVPNVLNLDSTTAAIQLTQKGFVFNPQSAPSDTVAKGQRDLDQPAAEHAAPKGSPVTVVVSTGPELVTVKDVTGESEALAKSDLEGQGFVVFVAHTSSTPANVGKVISQDPPGGSQRAKNTTIVINVGEAPPTTTSSTTTTGP